MKGFAHLSPLQLAGLAFVGGFGGGVLFLLPIASGSPHRFAWMTLGIALFAAETFLIFKVQAELKSGIANQRWSELQVEKLRSAVNSLPVTVTLFVSLLAWVSMVFLPNNLRHVAWYFYWPTLAINLLRISCKPPERTAPFERLDWNAVPRLQSQHWGER